MAIDLLIVTNYKGAWPYIPELRGMLMREGINVDVLDTGELNLIISGNAPRSIVPGWMHFFIGLPVVRPIALIFGLKYALRRLGRRYDIINLHYVNPLLVLCIKELRSLARKIIVSVWGSDFYRVGMNTKKFERRLYDAADAITFINPQTRDDLANFYQRYSGKSYIVRFGLGSIERIRSIMSAETPDVSRSVLGLPLDSRIIVCGYNSDPAQQHEKIIEMLRSVKSSLPDNSFIVFPMTYPHYHGYIKKIKVMLSDSGLPHKVFSGLMSDEDMARLRRVSDIVINIQTTDQLSASIQEHLYAGNIVISGKWLPYDIYDEMGIFFFRARDAAELKEQLIEAVGHLSEFSERCRKNASIIEGFSGWEGVIGQWKRLYENLLAA